MSIPKQVVSVSDLADPSTIKIIDVKTMNAEWIIDIKGEHYMRDFCFPIEAHFDLVEAVTKRQQLQKAFDQSMSLIYQTRNKHGGVK